MSNEQTTEIPVRTGLSPFTLDTFALDTKLLHCTPMRTSQLVSKGTYWTATRKEEHMLMDLVTKRFTKTLNDANLDMFLPVNRKAFLLRADDTNARHLLASKPISASVFAYLSNGKPPVSDADKYKRVHTTEDHNSGLKWYWTKIEFDDFEEKHVDDATLSQKFVLGDNSLISKDYCFAHLKFEIQFEEVTIEELVDQSGSSTNQLVASHTRDVVNAIVAKAAHLREHFDPDAQVLHGHKFYDVKNGSRQTIDVSGLKYCQGVSRTLWVTPQTNVPVTMDTQLCFKLFFPAISVADFLKQYFGSSEYHEEISNSIRGLHLEFTGPAGNLITRNVYKLEGEKPADFHDGKKHAAWLKSGNVLLQYPQMLCINVGSPYKHLLMPPELCKILPMQPFKSPLSPGVVRKLQSFRDNVHMSQPHLQQATATIIDHLVVHTDKKMELQEAEDLFKQSFGGKNPLVLFVEAGMNPRFPGSLTKLCEQVAQSMDGDDAKPLVLSLKYQPDKGPGKSTSIWRYQLNKFVTKHKVADRPSVLAIAVQPDQHPHDIYEKLKSMCDGCNVDGAKKTPNEMFRRMRIRNPLKPLAAEGPQNTAVAIHVTQVVSDMPEAHDNGKLGKARKLYLVAVVSRNMLNAERYKTTTRLLSARTMRDCDPTDFVLEHIEHWPGLANGQQHQLTILRTGQLTALAKDQLKEQITPDRVPKHTRKHLNIADARMGVRTSVAPAEQVNGTFVKINPTRGSTDCDGRLPKDTKNAVVAPEANLLKSGVQTAKKGTAFRYSSVLVEDGGNVHFTDEAKHNLGEAMEKRTRATLFIRDTKLANSETNKVRAHRKVTARNQAKPVTITLLGNRFANNDISKESNRMDRLPPNARPVALPTLHLNQGQHLGYGAYGAGSEASSLTGSPTRPYTYGASPYNLDGPADMPEYGGNGVVLDEYYNYRDDLKVAISPAQQPYPGNTSFSSKGYGDAAKHACTTPRFLPYREREFSREEAYRIAVSAGLRVTEGDPTEAKAEESQVPTDISRAELVVLAKLFHDDHLQLHDTKWPVPTYLAHLAAKRATGRITSDKWDGPKEIAPFALSEVANTVADSLYYLWASRLTTAAAA